MAENKLCYPAKIASNNPDSYGIIDATEVSGFRVITTPNKLYALPISILSITKTGEDAVGQYWWVISEKCYFQLVDWNNRTNPLGWAKIVPKVMSTSANNVDFNAERVQLKGGTETNPKNINPITTTSNVYDKNFSDRNLNLLSDILKDFDYRIDTSTTEVNVSILYPTGSSEGTNLYDIDTAITKLPDSVKRKGIKVSFLNSNAEYEVWQFVGDNISNIGSWEQCGPPVRGHIITNDSFIFAFTDEHDNVVFGIDHQGRMFAPKGMPDEVKERFDELSNIKVLNNTNNWLFAFADVNDNVVWGIQYNGIVYQGKGIPNDVKTEIDALKKRISALEGK